MKTLTQWPLNKKVEVEWIDSCSSHGWTSVEEHRENGTTAHCRSIGYVISQDKAFLCLAQSMGGTTQNVADVISIPMVAVLKMKKVLGGIP